jgi:MFS family permease
MIANVPGQGRSHFFALASMVYGLILGLGPMAWGAVVDLLGTWTWGPLNHHSLPYLAAAVIAALGGLLLRRIPEERHLTTTAFLAELVRLPARAMARFRE